MEPKKRLGQEQRIRRQTTFKHLVDRGQFARGEFFYLWVGKQPQRKKNASKAKPMLGVIVSRKTDPTSVGRNGWKRCVREIFREHQAQLRPEAICLIKVRHAKKRTSFLAAKEDLVSLFKKAGAWA